MAEKSITNLSLNSITISNSDFANASGYTAQSNILATNNTGNLILNDFNVLSSSSSKIISLINVPLNIPINTSVPLVIDLDQYTFDCTDETLCTFSYVGNGSSIYAESIVFNDVDNVLNLTLNNDGASIIAVTQFLINLYTP